MDRPADRPLSVREAKSRLRRTTDEALPTGYIRRHPYTMLVLALATGFFLARNPSLRKLVPLAILKALE